METKGHDDNAPPQAGTVTPLQAEPVPPSATSSVNASQNANPNGDDTQSPHLSSQQSPLKPVSRWRHGTFQIHYDELITYTDLPKHTEESEVVEGSTMAD